MLVFWVDPNVSPQRQHLSYNAVVTCRHITIISSASAPLNSKKITVKKVSDVDVGMFGPELQFSMYKCCFLACFCARQRAQRLIAELALAQIREKLPNRLAHNLAHMCRLIWKWIYAKQIAPRDTNAHMRGIRGSKIQKSWKLSKGLTDWHQLWFTSADSSGNGHRLNTCCPSIPQGHLRFFLGGHKFKSLGKLSNGWTDWHHIWYTSADSFGNGQRLNTIRASIPQGRFGGF